MKALIISDLHHGHSQSEYFLKYELNLFNWFEKIIDEHGIDTIINLGDTSDKQLSVSTKVAKLFSEAHKKLASKVERYFVLAGNHDCFYKTSNEITGLPVFFKDIPNVIMIENEPLIYDKFCFIPWMSPGNSAEIKEFVRQNNKKENYLFAHLEASGFKNGAITTKSDQLYISEYNNYNKVFTGHYHAKQEKGNMLYVGNPFQKTFGEIERKFVHVLDGDGIISIENENAIFTRILFKEGLEDAEIAEVASHLTGKICQVFVNSSDFDYINKVETEIEKNAPYSVTVRTKNLEAYSDDDIEIDNSTEEELNASFLSQLDYPSEEIKDDFQGKFQMYWSQS